jgi:hypothetical protein
MMSKVCGQGNGTTVFVLAASWVKDSGDADVIGTTSDGFGAGAGAVAEVGVLEVIII